MEGKRNWAYVQDPAPLSSISQTPSYQDFRTKNQLDIPSNGEKKIKMTRILAFEVVTHVCICFYERYFKRDDISSLRNKPSGWSLEIHMICGDSCEKSRARKNWELCSSLKSSSSKKTCFRAASALDNTQNLNFKSEIKIFIRNLSKVIIKVVIDRHSQQEFWVYFCVPAKKKSGLFSSW